LEYYIRQMNTLLSYFLLLSALLFSGLYPSNQAQAGTTNERCYISNCLCEVRPGPRTSSRTHDEITKRALSVFFEEDQYILSIKQRGDLISFFSKFKKSRNKASIIGYTDGCGSFAYNKELSSKRAEEVFLIAKNYLSPSHIGKISGGENSREHLAGARRVDVIVHTHKRITTAIEKIPADYYLIDASGSMWSNYRDWNDIINASVKPNSKVFLSMTNGCHNGQRMIRVRPQGGTEIWWSYWHVIEKMSPGETLLIVSDFQSQIPLSSREYWLFKEKVRQARIIVYSIKP
jgi:outer membrane protein OmpA-like peptidoglycan-associated protein